MLNWLLGLLPKPHMSSAGRSIESALNELEIMWVQADHETKLAAGQFMMDILRLLIPEYNFARNYHIQVFVFVKDMSPTLLMQNAKHFAETAANEKTKNPALFISMGIVSQFFSLFACDQAGFLYTAHSWTVNDIIQYVLYHRSVKASAI